MMSNDKNQQKLSAEEKKKKQEEIAKRLAEIQTKVNVPSESKAKEKTPPSVTTVPTVKSQATATKADSTATTPKQIEKTPTPSSISNENKEWSANQLKKESDDKEDVPLFKPTPALKEKKEKTTTATTTLKKKATTNRKKRQWVVLLIILGLLFAGVGWWQLNLRNTSNTAAKEVNNTSDPLLQTEAATKSNPQDDIEAKASPEATMEEKATEEIVSEKKVPTKEINEPLVVQNEKPEPEAKSLKHRSVIPTLPCYIISHSSLKNENQAKAEVDKLKSSGLPAGYYWIPDHDPNGNPFFKVYIGPYATMEEGLRKLRTLKGLQRDTYLYFMREKS
jgi:hypothetical protein